MTRKPTYKVVNAYINSHAQFCADTVRAADEHWVFVPCSFEVEDATEASDFGISAHTTSRSHARLDDLDKRIAGIHRNTCLSVCQTFDGTLFCRF